MAALRPQILQERVLIADALKQIDWEEGSLGVDGGEGGTVVVCLINSPGYSLAVDLFPGSALSGGLSTGPVDLCFPPFFPLKTG